MDSAEFQQRAEQIERMVQRITAIRDEDARAAALELMQSVMDLHGAEITRLLEILSESGESGRSSLEKIASDPLVCGLLVLYGLHPVPVEDRVFAAIENIRPQLGKQGGSVELLAIADDAVRVSVQSSGNGCHSSPDALGRLVEQAIREAAPDIARVLIESPAPSTSGFVPLNMLQSGTNEDKRYEESAA